MVTQTETGEDIQELACLERETEGLESIGISLAEAKALLAALQKQVARQQVAAYLADRNASIWENKLAGIAENVDDELNGKAKAEIDAFIDEKADALFAPVYGQVPVFANFHYSVSGEYSEIAAALKCPHCAQAFRHNPLAELLTEHCSPERLYLETKWASLVSFCGF